MIERLQKLPLPSKILAVAAAATVMLALAAGVGAMTALVLGPDPDSSGGGPERIGGAEHQREAGSPQGENQPEQAGRDGGTEQAGRDGGTEQAGRDGGAPDRLSEAEYVGTVGDIQAGAVEVFQDSHDKLLLYDALSASDVEKMQVNEAALEELTVRARSLAPPLEYEEQHEVFSSAVDELHEATRLAYSMAADPVAAAELGFDEYDEHVNEASTLLQRSNELLGKDYKALGGIREISPEF
jgi:hypothetical protein